MTKAYIESIIAKHMGKSTYTVEESNEYDEFLKSLDYTIAEFNPTECGYSYIGCISYGYNGYSYGCADCDVCENYYYNYTTGDVVVDYD